MGRAGRERWHLKKGKFMDAKALGRVFTGFEEL
jgi:hypothetical protein